MYIYLHTFVVFYTYDRDFLSFYIILFQCEFNQSALLISVKNRWAGYSFSLTNLSQTLRISLKVLYELPFLIFSLAFLRIFNLQIFWENCGIVLNYYLGFIKVSEEFLLIRIFAFFSIAISFLRVFNFQISSVPNKQAKPIA